MRLLLIEDDAKIAKSLLGMLAPEGFDVQWADNGLRGLELAMSGHFDVAIIDVMLPQMDGLTLIERLRRAHVNTPILILSARQSVDDRVAGLKTGGDDYLTKPFAFSELIARLHSLVRRAAGTPENTWLTVADMTMDVLRREVKRGSRRIDLQPREFALLEYLMRNAGRVVSKSMIVSHVWDYNFDPMTNVVEARVCRLREKVDHENEPRLIHTIRGAGYVLREDSPSA